MLTVNQKSAIRRAGTLCLVLSGMSMMSCHQESVVPQIRSNNGYVMPTHVQSDSVKTQENQPPKDVGSGSGTSATMPIDSMRTNDDQPPKDVGSGSGSGK